MPALTLDQRLTRMSRCSGIHVAYSLPMLGGRIDRDAWAREVDALVVRFDPGPRGNGNKSAFARRIGMTRMTLERWAARATDISPDSVRQILERLALEPKEQVALLTRVGYLVPGGTLSPPGVPNPYNDRVVQEILADEDLTEAQRADLVQVQIDRIDADFMRRLQEYRRVRAILGRGDSIGREDAS